jgi:hypothetical protein
MAVSPILINAFMKSEKIVTQRPEIILAAACSCRHSVEQCKKYGTEVMFVFLGFFEKKSFTLLI